MNEGQTRPSYRHFRLSARRIGGFSIMAGLLLGTAIPSPVFAQGAEAAAQTNTGITDIIVTAQRRAESIQSVPIAVSALSAEQLKEHNVTQISDLQATTPNVTFGGTAQGVQASPPGIRGMRNSNIELTNEQPTAVYIDGVYQAVSHGTMAMLGPDVERIEVLRGPQGTLFGRNTVGGAVSITTRKPSDEWEGRAMLGAGNYGLMEGQAMINIPLVSDVMAARFNVGYRDDDGWVRERNFGYHLGQTTTFFARGQLSIQASDSFNILVEGDYVKSSSDGQLQQLVYLTRPIDGVPLPAYALYAAARGYAPTDANYDAVFALLAECGAGATPNFKPRCYGTLPNTPRPDNTGLFTANQSTDPYSFFRNYGGAVTATWNVTDDIELKSTSALSHFENTTRRDYGVADPVLLFGDQSPRGKTFTQELLLNGSLFADLLKFTLGAFYYDFRGREIGTNDVLFAFQGDVAASYLDNKIHNKSIGLFGQATYALTDRWNVTAGIRYNDERKRNDTTQYGSRPAPELQRCTLPFVNTECVNTTKLHYTDVDYAFSTDFKVTDQVLVYARVAKGFQAGGINQRGAPGAPFVKYDPTTAVNYELGFKADLFDRHVRLNMAAFQTDIKGLQRTLAFSYTVNGTTSQVVTTINAASGRLRGAEAELTIAPTDNARISFQVGYTDPKYKRFVSGGLDLSHTDWQQISKWTFGISPSYTLPTSFGKVVASLDYFYRSSNNLYPALSAPTEEVLPVPGLIQRGYGLLNGRLAFEIGHDTEIALWGKNILNKHYFDAGLSLAGTLGVANANLGAPRTYGIQFSHDF